MRTPGSSRCCAGIGNTGVVTDLVDIELQIGALTLRHRCSAPARRNGTADLEGRPSLRRARERRLLPAPCLPARDYWTLQRCRRGVTFPRADFRQPDGDIRCCRAGQLFPTAHPPAQPDVIGSDRTRARSLDISRFMRRGSFWLFGFPTLPSVSEIPTKDRPRHLGRMAKHSAFVPGRARAVNVGSPISTTISW